jgi:hypothetical protein
VQRSLGPSVALRKPPAFDFAFRGRVSGTRAAPIDRFVFSFRCTDFRGLRVFLAAPRLVTAHKVNHNSPMDDARCFDFGRRPTVRTDGDCAPALLIGAPATGSREGVRTIAASLGVSVAALQQWTRGSVKPRRFRPIAIAPQRRRSRRARPWPFR